TKFCKIHDANDRFQCSTAFCTYRSPPDVTRHFFASKRTTINVWKSVDEEIDIPRVLDHSVRISRFLDNVSNYFENLYKPSEFLADAEQHLSTCGRSETSYPSAGENYVRRQPCQEAPIDAADMVKRLIIPWCRKGRNITMYNFFTSIPLAEDLLAKT
ncbi:hypothetical protein T07_14889, partial [Trichinella nelsoni]